MSSVVKETEEKMRNGVDHFKKELRNLRTGRPHPGMLDSVIVEVYGSEMKLKELAQVSVPDSRQLLVTPFDPQTAGAISKGIDKANLNLKPILESGLVRIPVPPLTEEIRRDTVKVGKKKCEETKVQIREIRRKTNDLVKKQKADGIIAEDMLKKLEKQVQELTDKYCKELDTLMSEKEKEIMEV